MDDRLLPLLLAQDGVVSRRQALSGRPDPREHRPPRPAPRARAALPRVYVDHTGETVVGPARLGSRPLGMAGGPEPRLGAGCGRGAGSSHRTEPLHIAVARDRHLDAGARDRRPPQRARPWTRSQPGSPPRMRYDEAAIDVVSACDDEDEVVAELGRILQTRRTTAARLMAAMDGTGAGCRHRALLDDILGDAAAGATSALERSFLREGRAGPRAARCSTSAPRRHRGGHRPTATPSTRCGGVLRRRAGRTPVPRHRATARPGPRPGPRDAPAPRHRDRATRMGPVPRTTVPHSRAAGCRPA